MKQKNKFFLNSVLVIVFMISLQVMPKLAFAGEMVIEVGTVFSQTFVKDGRRVEVSKTYTWEGVVIHQKIYNEATGELIRESTTTNPIGENVRLVSSNEIQEQTQNQVEETKTTQEETENENEKEEPAEIEKTPIPTIDPNLVDTQSEDEDNFGPETLVEESKEKYNLDTINDVLARNTNSGSELIIHAYQIRKLLGIFEVKTPVQLTIDAESGDLINETQPLISKIVSLFSSN
jgi:hypothetical protein